MSALENSGRLPASAYQGATMYTTLSPCDMCTGACLLYKVKRVVIGENKNFVGGEQYLKDRGVEVVVLDNEECKQLMEKFIREKPDLWYAFIMPLLVCFRSSMDFLFWNTSLTTSTSVAGMRILRSRSIITSPAV